VGVSPARYRREGPPPFLYVSMTFSPPEIFGGDVFSGKDIENTLGPFFSTELSPAAELGLRSISFYSLFFFPCILWAMTFPFSPRSSRRGPAQSPSCAGQRYCAFSSAKLFFFSSKKVSYPPLSLPEGHHVRGGVFGRCMKRRGTAFLFPFFFSPSGGLDLLPGR